uniref:Putative N-acetylmannosamine-6-phosphate 2-epimerase n=1 Tax=Thermosporothrix sp. COM3 TaxID=2490863 RepID=A0A455SE13_9CHLR|nr:putative N-acetylmannosamine-6-phosphate 2-epimerase [Thermosporothrix sp. COM3]
MKDITSLRGALIVSCQAFEGEPLFGHMAAMAAAVLNGGAKGIRTNGKADVAAIRAITDVPIIGIQKTTVAGRTVITPDFSQARELVEAGADIIALDATQIREQVCQGKYPTAAELIAQIHAELGCLVMADISTVEEGVAAVEAGADLVATTLAGYTPYTTLDEGPDEQLVRELTRRIQVPVVAEGKINTPAAARKALACGAYAVVVGSAITRPHLVTRGFVDALTEAETC